MTQYFRRSPDPGRGWALAGGLRLPQLTPSAFRALACARADPALLRLSHDFAGDLAGTVSLIWPGGAAARRSA